MAAEAAGIEPELDTAGERQLPDVQHGPLGPGPVEPLVDLVRPSRLHGRVVERAPVSVQHHPVAAPDAYAHLR